VEKRSSIEQSSRSTGVSEFQKQREVSVQFIFRRFPRRPSFSGIVVVSISAVSKRLRPPFRRKRIESTVQIERRRYAEGGREIERIKNHSREAGKEKERERHVQIE